MPNWILVGAGLWTVFDGAVSATYFANKDKTTKNTYDQAVRIVRMGVGIIVTVVGIYA
jgi:hypothetical protein